MPEELPGPSGSAKIVGAVDAAAAETRAAGDGLPFLIVDDPAGEKWRAYWNQLFPDTPIGPVKPAAGPSAPDDPKPDHVVTE